MANTNPKTTKGLIGLATGVVQSSPLKDRTRDELVRDIRNVQGGLPFAIALGDDEDDDTAWVEFDKATDDQLRFYIAFNYVRAYVGDAIQESFDEMLRAGEIEIAGTDADGRQLFRRTAKVKVDDDDEKGGA